MGSKLIHIEGRHFIGWFVCLFVVCLVLMFTMLRVEPLIDHGWRCVVAPYFMAVVIAVAGSFVICGVRQVVYELRNGEMVLANILVPVLNMLLMTGLLALMHVILPVRTRAREASILIALVIVFLVDVLVWMIRMKTGCRNSSYTLKSSGVESRDGGPCFKNE